MRHALYIGGAGWLAAAAVALAGCARQDEHTYQGYVEGEFVYVASPAGGRLEHLGVQRGQTVDAGAPVSYTHLTLPTNTVTCRSRWSPYH